MPNSTSQSISTLLPSARERINIPDIIHRVLLFSNQSTRVNALRVSCMWYELAGPMVYRTLTYDFTGFPFVRKGRNNGPASGQNPFEVLNREQYTHSMIAGDSSTGHGRRGGPKRTRKIDLIRHCRVLRIPYHEPGRICSNHANHLLDPKVIVVAFSKTVPMDRFGKPGTAGLSPFTHGCSCLNGLIFSKLLMHTPTYAPDLLMPLEDVASFALIITATASNSEDGKHLKRINNVAVIAKMKVSSGEQKQRALHPDNMMLLANYAHYILSHNHLPTVTFVNTENLWPQISETVMFGLLSHLPPKPFKECLKEEFFDVMSNDSEEEKEAIWSRIHFESKASYMTRDPKELEGVLAELGW